jgi:hypothetical protein
MSVGSAAVPITETGRECGTSASSAERDEHASVQLGVDLEHLGAERAPLQLRLGADQQHDVHVGAEHRRRRRAR